MLKHVAFNKVKVSDSFWAPRILTTQNVTLDYCLSKCEETGRIRNFKEAAKTIRTGAKGEFTGIYFNDSDVYKVLEGIAYSLMLNRDPKLESRADELIDIISSAQEADGYLLCYFTLGMGERWTDMEKHEMYCAGHLMEAAVAYFQATGKDALLKTAVRLANHLDDNFGPGKRHWVTGHQEVELALVKLYKATGEERYLNLAHFLLEERGHGHGKGAIWDSGRFPDGAAYCQDDIPVSQQERVTGHAVRAMYMYSGMADVTVEKNNTGYWDTLKKLWRNIALQNMYITGGIGPSKHNEGFTTDYDMPNQTAYCETCASVAMVYLNDRLNNLWEEGVYADVLERAMYNGALAGVSLSGDKFFYVNPLESDGSHHRKEWFDCSCCPTQISRFLPSVGGYVYKTNEDSLYVNLFVESEAEMELGGQALCCSQTTNYPWDGAVELKLTKIPSALKFIKLRIPGWCKSFAAKVNGAAAKCHCKNGYAVIEAAWKTGDVVGYSMDMPAEKMHADPRVEANIGLTAVQRGPLVYCAEAVDNPGLSEAFISDGAVISTIYKKDLLGGIVALDVHNPDGSSLRMVPYYAWDNREAGAMKVWLPEKKEREGLYSA